jgi:hypothetical protein
VSHIFVDELPGDPEMKNHRRQVCSLHAIPPCSPVVLQLGGSVSCI